MSAPPHTSTLLCPRNTYNTRGNKAKERAWQVDGQSFELGWKLDYLKTFFSPACTTRTQPTLLPPPPSPPTHTHAHTHTSKVGTMSMPILLATRALGTARGRGMDGAAVKPETRTTKQHVKLGHGVFGRARRKKRCCLVKAPTAGKCR